MIPFFFTCVISSVLMLKINAFVSIVKLSILISLTLKYPWLVFILYTLFSVKKRKFINSFAL